eukprot:m.84484 g.84484  ORF g.84484 m.84484 type:complete len:126 (+) comp14688_c0_seq2:1914-2291(+)
MRRTVLGSIQIVMQPTILRSMLQTMEGSLLAASRKDRGLLDRVGSWRKELLALFKPAPPLAALRVLVLGLGGSDLPDLIVQMAQACTMRHLTRVHLVSRVCGLAGLCSKMTELARMWLLLGYTRC